MTVLCICVCVCWHDMRNRQWRKRHWGQGKPNITLKVTQGYETGNRIANQGCLQILSVPLYPYFAPRMCEVVHSLSSAFIYSPLQPFRHPSISSFLSPPHIHLSRHLLSDPPYPCCLKFIYSRCNPGKLSCLELPHLKL